MVAMPLNVGPNTAMKIDFVITDVDARIYRPIDS